MWTQECPLQAPMGATISLAGRTASQDSQSECRGQAQHLAMDIWRVFSLWILLHPGYPGTSLLCQQPSPNRRCTSSLSCQSCAVMRLPNLITSPKKELKPQIASTNLIGGRHPTKPTPRRGGLAPRPFFPRPSHAQLLTSVFLSTGGRVYL